MKSESKNVEREQKWYFGGIAAAAATCLTHPLDTIKVVLQTSSEKLSVLGATRNIIKTTGVSGLYKGVSAAVVRQLLSSGARFGVYVKLGEELAKRDLKKQKKWLLANSTCAGACAGLLSTPADIVNVRMQTDSRLPPEKRRNYKNVFDGFYRITKEEGFFTLYKGASLVVLRSVLITCGVFVVYDVSKEFLLSTKYFIDDPTTHFTASTLAGICGTFVTQPLDVLKTRAMNSKAGQYSGLPDLFFQTLKTGPQTFFKGMLPSGVRILPQTILTFMILEQITKYFGRIKQK